MNAIGIKSENKKGLYSDGGGLYLQVSSYNTKSWIFRFTLNKRKRDMGLGPYPDISLARARDEAHKSRDLVREGVDPIEKRKADKLALNAETLKTVTFKECAEKYISSHSISWKSVKHAQQWTNTLDTYVYPHIGVLSVADVDIGLILKILEPIWTSKPETASRVRGRIESILDWASVRKYREGENPARWKGNLKTLLPARNRVQKVKHHQALPYSEIAELMIELKEQDGIASLGLQFLILTAARTSEVIEAEWSEIDKEKALWVVPAERMKSGKEHRVPLSESALEVLQNLEEVRQSKYILPGQGGRGHLSNMAFLNLLKRMKRKGLTVHGFRSTFKDWVSESTNYPNEVSEMALAHAVGSQVEAAYRRGDLFQKRVWLMRDWSLFVLSASGKCEIVKFEAGSS
nr:site-specific integrase [Sneathiella aquimaris]